MAPRPTAASAPIRPARAAMFATACTALAVGGHVAAGRDTVAIRAVVAGFAILYLVAWVLTGTERSLATIVGGLLGGQFLLHALFAAASTSAAPAGALVRAHAMRPLPPSGAAAAGSATLAAETGGGGLAMTIAHVAAALVAAWWLRRGERAAWTLARRTAALAAYPLRALRSLVALVDAALSPDSLLAPAGPYDTARPHRPASVPARGPVTRRGPPFGTTAFTLR
ncbi:MAG TPA: hypothetical protein VFU43_29450 [Streptosporangiaceae bacterium]|nr:hypothetical protein [Streptosporangiaceae bacterium]